MSTSFQSSDSQQSNSQYHFEKGKAIIICNYEFENKKYNRKGSEKDVEPLCKALKNLKFTVDTYSDLKAEDMIDKIKAAASECGPDIDAFLCVTNSHGCFLNVNESDENSQAIHGTDKEITVLELLEAANLDCLNEKPKIFLLHHCRGKRWPSNIDVEEGDAGKVVSANVDKSDVKKDCTVKIMPINPSPHYFLHFSSNEGFYSFCTTKGSPFLLKWCDVLEDMRKREIMDLATEVNNRVCREYTSYAPSKEVLGLHNRKMTPEFISTLRRDFYFLM